MLSRITSEVASSRWCGSCPTEGRSPISIRNAAAAIAASGWTGGPRPFGYEADGMTVREVEAAAVRKAYEALALGASLASIACDWNGAGLRTGRSGREWTTAGVRECLKNPRYAGRRGYLGEDIGPAAWPAIVPEETWLATRGILTAPGRVSAQHDGRDEERLARPARGRLRRHRPGRRGAARDRVLSLCRNPDSVPADAGLEALLTRSAVFDGLPDDAGLMLLLQMHWPWTEGMRANAVTINEHWTAEDRRLLEEGRRGVP